jgi:hypothetical protein
MVPEDDAPLRPLRPLRLLKAKHCVGMTASYSHERSGRHVRAREEGRKDGE